MPTKYQSDQGVISPTADATHKFPIYFCEECNAPNAGFGIARGEGRLSYCGYDGRPVCTAKVGGELAQGQGLAP